jgi:hypothetical protein
VCRSRSGGTSAGTDSKSPMHSFELRTSSTLPRCSRVTSHPEVMPRNKLSTTRARGRLGEVSSVGTGRCASVN